MTTRALAAVGEHLEQVTALIRSQVAQAAAEEGGGLVELEQLCAALARSTEALSPASQAGEGGGGGGGSVSLTSVERSQPAPAIAIRPPPIDVGDSANVAEGAASHGGAATPGSGDKVSEDDAERTGSKSTEGSTAMHSGKLFEGASPTGMAWKKTKSRNQVVRRMEDFMESSQCEFFFACLILLNVTGIILESQFKGAEIGYEIGYHSFYGSKKFLEQTGAPTDSTFHVAEIIFATLFTIELILRIALLRCDFFMDPWGWLDTGVVVITDAILVLPVSFMNVSFLRALRLARLLRLLRLARKIQTFDSLYLMTTALTGSVSVLMWVVVLLFIIQTIAALVLTSIVQDWYLKPESGSGDDWMSKEVKTEVFQYWGTYWRSMVSLFELMLANWPPICRLMMEQMWEPWSALVIMYKLTMGFAVIGVIFGVFTQETFRAAETNDQLMLRKKTAQTGLHSQKMKMLFSMMAQKQELSPDAQIDLKQFKQFLENKDIQMWLKAMDYDTSDAGLLFHLIDRNGDGNLTVDELIDGMGSLKGGARNIDVKLMLRQSTVGRMQRVRRLSTTEALKIVENELPEPPTVMRPSLTMMHSLSMSPAASHDLRNNGVRANVPGGQQLG